MTRKGWKDRNGEDSMSMLVTCVHAGHSIDVPITLVQKLPAAVLQRALAEWLLSQNWDHFFTGTFGRPASLDDARKAVSAFKRRLEQAAQGRIRMFVAYEQASFDDYHVHCLIEGTAALADDRLDKAWAPGRSSTDKYDPNRGGCFYVTKQLYTGGNYFEVLGSLRSQTRSDAQRGDVESKRPSS
jgi:hypothetical protein